jgi:pantoate--beta-alanine ligase
MPVKIVAHPTVREEDGLALSSRNRLLTPEARRVAPRIHQALIATAMEAEEGEHRVARLRGGLVKELAAIPGAVVDYAEILDGETLGSLKTAKPGTGVRIFAAVRLGSVRLIDNLPL